MKNLITSERSKLRTNAKRGVYDYELIVNILDSSFICHAGFAVESQPFVIPTCYGREDDKIFFHGAKGSRMMKHMKTGADVCITVTLLDGIVLARSAFHHSINYRSVIIFGKAMEIIETDEKEKALKIISEQITPGRWNDVRKPNSKELNATSVFCIRINEASAKVREGGPVDDEEDLNLNIWAGVLPLKITAFPPVKDSIIKENISTPEYLLNYRK